MRTYVDSGVLIKLYVQEEFSEEAAAVASKLDQIPISPLHDLEIRNALRAQCGRGILTDNEMEAGLALMEGDIAAGRLFRLSPDWPEVYRIGESLSRRYAATLLCRALDILHVALAVAWDCTRLVTGDRRQGQLSRKANLKVVQIGAARARR